MKEIETMAENILSRIPVISRDLIIAKVESSPPNLHLKYSEQIIYPEQIYCSNYLLQEYHRDYRLKGIIDQQHQDVNGSSMTLNGLGPHEHKITTIDSTGKYEHHGDLWLTDTLKQGDEVLVAIVGMFYIVVTKITKMPNKAIEGV